MTKAKARLLLDLYVEYNNFPLVDAIVTEEETKEGVTAYSFKGLLCIVYDLKDDSE